MTNERERERQRQTQACKTFNLKSYRLVYNPTIEYQQSSIMKGNDGRAARRRSIKRILVGISTVFLVLLVRYIITTTQKETTTKLSMLRNGAKDSVNKAREFRKELEHSYANEHDEGQLLQQILEAKIHLVDLEVVEEELMQAHPSTYAGVYGHFCQLNFAAHKHDTSAGTLFGRVLLPPSLSLSLSLSLLFLTKFHPVVLFLKSPCFVILSIIHLIVRRMVISK